jgi:hypothetical protein
MMIIMTAIMIMRQNILLWWLFYEFLEITALYKNVFWVPELLLEKIKAVAERKIKFEWCCPSFSLSKGTKAKWRIYHQVLERGNLGRSAGLVTRC